MVRAASKSTSPFKGPEPFTEVDAGRFFGRDQEIRALLDRLRLDRMTVLTAESGAGKTSLIQAGLIPALRLLRETGGATRPGPVIYIQGRGPERQASSAPLIVHRIREEIERLTAYCADPNQTPLMGQSTLRVDLEALAAVPSPLEPHSRLTPGSIEERDWLLQYLVALCDAVEDRRLILIIDQLEELLGSGASGYTRTQGGLALQLIGTAFLREERLQLLLSLREEFTGRLRPLDALVGAVVRRTYALLPLTVSVFRESAMLTARSSADDGSGTPLITEAAIDQILDWTCANNHSPSAPVDALVAQAVFNDVCLKEATRSSDTGAVVDITALMRYESELTAELMLDESTSERIAEGAMFRHITRALQSPEETSRDKVAEHHVMRAAARMGASLASPQGFKRHVSDSQLVLDALGEDLRTPPMSGVSRRDISALIHVLRGGTRDGSDISMDVKTPTEAQRKTELLVRDALSAIRLLKAGNVLKAHGLDEHRNEVIALQHDGFGPALDRWGEQYRNRIEDALASRVGCFGTPIPKGSKLENMTIESLNWIGCRLDSAKLHNVCFQHCDFTSSWFQDCELHDCRFIDCELPAIGMKGCTISNTHFDTCRLLSAAFLGTAWSGVRVRDSNAAGLLVTDRCTWGDHVEFLRSDVSGAVIKSVILRGTLRLEECVLHYAQLHAFNAIDPQAAHTYAHIEVRHCRLHGALLADYDRIPNVNKSDNTEIADYGIATPPVDA